MILFGLYWENKIEDFLYWENKNLDFLYLHSYYEIHSCRHIKSVAIF